MSRTFTRTEILDRLHAKISRHEPILVATAGNGLIARSLEAGGVDLLLTSVTGMSRQRGLPSIGWRMDENNIAVAEIVDEIKTVVNDTPLIVSIAASEPAIDANLGDVIEGFQQIGYSGLLNYPTFGSVESEALENQHDEYIARGKRPGASEYAIRVSQAVESGRVREEEVVSAGRGFPREVQLIEAANRLDVFSIAYAWTPEQARQVVTAGADVVIGHCGGTAGGAAGEAMQSHEDAAEWLNTIFAAAQELRPDVLLLGHGGPFSAPADTRRLYELTDAIGFLSGSAVERIPVERAVQDAVRSFHAVTVPDRDADR